ncbi:cyclic nucleotide-binding domain-containing protein [Gimesia panareensis]|uniref:cyclic nucleotide-binding domain-containing protein n=1 Tax=Gimesia panareensis TaxID=2527978 RepID=UPI0011889DA7|nr:cyclic nucleotide-binding domain-containing protein [Gimesia panareensis]QDU49225.1 Electron transport protein HydN [Gimesia panareensis]
MSEPSVSRPRRWDKPFSLEAGSEQEMTDAGVEELLQQPPFSEIDASGFKRSLPLHDILKNDARIVGFDDGDIIVRRGDWGNSAFFVLSGTVRVELERGESSLPDEILGRRRSRVKSLWESIAQLWRNHREPEVREVAEVSGSSSPLQTRMTRGRTRIYLQEVSAVLDKYRTARLEAGHWFGELAALGRTSRVATVFSEGVSQLLEIRWQGIRDILRHDASGGLKRYIEDAFRERALAAFLRTDPLFQGCSTELMQRIVDQVEFQTYGNYDSSKPFKELNSNLEQNTESGEPVIIHEGEIPRGIIMIRSGLARITQQYYQGRRTIGYLSPGQIFGLDEIRTSIHSSSSQPCQTQLSAIGHLNAVLVPAGLVEEILQQQMTTQNGSEKVKQPPARQTVKIQDEALLSQLIDRNYVEGTSLMVIDLDRCTRCDDCVRACATAHDNNPRFIRHGPVLNQFMVPSACLHCVDPVCMIECPTGAIFRDLGQGDIVINDQTCIGCAQCASNCPFDAIRMVDIRDASGDLIVDSKTRAPLTQATKCDLCIDQRGGPACESACPHDALFRVDMQDAARVEEVFAR